MRLHINLASEPFRRDRHVMAGFGALSALLVCTLAILTYLAISARDRAAVMRGEVERLNAQVRSLSNQQSQYDGTLRQPANASAAMAITTTVLIPMASTPSHTGDSRARLCSREARAAGSTWPPRRAAAPVPTSAAASSPSAPLIRRRKALTGRSTVT